MGCNIPRHAHRVTLGAIACAVAKLVPGAYGFFQGHEMVSQAFKNGFISNIISLIVKLMFIWYVYLDIEFCWYLFHSFVWCMGAEHTMGHVSLKKVNTSIPILSLLQATLHAHVPVWVAVPRSKKNCWSESCWNLQSNQRTALLVCSNPLGAASGSVSNQSEKLILRFQLRDLSLLPVSSYILI